MFLGRMARSSPLAFRVHIYINNGIKKRRRLNSSSALIKFKSNDWVYLEWIIPFNTASGMRGKWSYHTPVAS